MPLRLEVKKKLSARSERVKSVDVHPTESWVLSALFSGSAIIWDYESGTSVKSFEVCQLPVRCAKFITRRQWFVAGSDDMHLRVFNYNTMEKVKDWEAHVDYIRYIEVHPTRPYILSCADDMTIKMWDWEKDFDCVQVFEGHAHYVMMIKVNPRDSNTFATASLDRTIKVWGLTGALPHFSLEGHDKGVNCVEYYPGGDKPYLVSGADDRTVKVWDYQTKACLQTLDGHTHNVTAACFHPRLPLLISASEDGTVRIWHSITYRPETTLNYGMERAWCLAPTKDANKLAIGFDEGTIVLKLGNEIPVASLDTQGGKLVWAQSFDIQTMTLKGLHPEDTVDGERLALTPRDLGACEIYPQSMSHDRNGNFIVVCGDGEYIIYTSQTLRNKGFGSALDFVWSTIGSGDYAIRESISRVKTFKSFKEHKPIRLPMATAEGLAGGAALGVIGGDCIAFFDWNEGEFIRRIDVAPHAVYWSNTGEHVVLACSDSYFVLRYNQAAVNAALATGAVSVEEGVEGAFELLSEISDKVRTAQWVGECFLYTNYANRLQYYVGGEVMTLAHLDRIMYLLGYVKREERVFLIDRAYNVVSYRVLEAVLDYQTYVVRQEFDRANERIAQIPQSEYPAIARFLESQGFKEEALAVTTDMDHKFDLAMDLKKMDVAHALLLEIPEEEKDTTDTQTKWRRLGDIALARGDLDLAKQCAINSGDLSGLLLLYSASCDKHGMKDLAVRARQAGRTNVAFVAYFVTSQVEECIGILLETSRYSEAAFMARTYMPSKVSEVVALWKEQLQASNNERVAASLADPAEYPNLFPDLEWAFRVEELFKQNRDMPIPASQYLAAKPQLDMDLIEVLKAQGTAQPANGNHVAPAAVAATASLSPVSPASPTSPTSAESPASPVAAASPSPKSASQNGFEESPTKPNPSTPSPVAHELPAAEEPSSAADDELVAEAADEAEVDDLDKLEAEANDLLGEDDDDDLLADEDENW